MPLGFGGLAEPIGELPDGPHRSTSIKDDGAPGRTREGQKAAASGIIGYLGDGSWTKRMHPGWPAPSALRAYAPAKSGFVGPRKVFEGVHGAFRTFAPCIEAKAGRAAQRLGRKVRERPQHLEAYPCGAMVQPCTDCAISLRRQGAPLEGIASAGAQILIEGSLGAQVLLVEFARLPRVLVGAVLSTFLLGVFVLALCAPVLSLVLEGDLLSLSLALSPGGSGEVVASAKALEAQVIWWSAFSSFAPSAATSLRLCSSAVDAARSRRAEQVRMCAACIFRSRSAPIRGFGCCWLPSPVRGSARP